MSKTNTQQATDNEKTRNKIKKAQQTKPYGKNAQRPLKI